ncbi:MAG TPA: D-alanyl-D-alanine carboxypeptidase, partial [Sphingomicrobium sp.]|nr:D-alanyl-D-alanine carboxypeptidase [Sphingomicrobium sp.]
NAWTAKPLYRAGAQVGTAKVQLGDDDQVALLAPRNLSLTIPAGLASRPMAMKIRYNGPLKAPIAKGAHVADLVVSSPDTGEQVMPLIAAEAVDEAGFFGRAWIAFKQLVGLA